MLTDKTAARSSRFTDKERKADIKSAGTYFDNYEKIQEAPKITRFILRRLIELGIYSIIWIYWFGIETLIVGLIPPVSGCISIGIYLFIGRPRVVFWKRWRLMIWEKLRVFRDAEYNENEDFDGYE
jgi:hypothetical protein